MEKKKEKKRKKNKFPAQDALQFQGNANKAALNVPEVNVSLSPTL